MCCNEGIMLSRVRIIKVVSFLVPKWELSSFRFSSVSSVSSIRVCLPGCMGMWLGRQTHKLLWHRMPSVFERTAFTWHCRARSRNDKKRRKGVKVRLPFTPQYDRDVTVRSAFLSRKLFNMSVYLASFFFSKKMSFLTEGSGCKKKVRRNFVSEHEGIRISFSFT